MVASKAEWIEIARRHRPGLTDADYEGLWADYLAFEEEQKEKAA